MVPSCQRKRRIYTAVRRGCSRRGFRGSDCMLFNRAADNSKSSDRRSWKRFTPRKLDDKGDKLHVVLSQYCKQVTGLYIKAALLSLIFTSAPNTGKIGIALRSTQLLKSLKLPCAPQDCDNWDWSACSLSICSFFHVEQIEEKLMTTF